MNFLPISSQNPGIATYQETSPNDVSFIANTPEIKPIKETLAHRCIKIDRLEFCQVIESLPKKFFVTSRKKEKIPPIEFIIKKECGEIVDINDPEKVRTFQRQILSLHKLAVSESVENASDTEKFIKAFVKIRKSEATVSKNQEIEMTTTIKKLRIRTTMNLFRQFLEEKKCPCCHTSIE